MTPLSTVALGDSVLKWYTSLPRTSRYRIGSGSSRGAGWAMVRLGELRLGASLGFVILHRCGEASFLLVSTWENDNELWETVRAKDGDNDP